MDLALFSAKPSNVNRYTNLLQIKQVYKISVFAKPPPTFLRPFSRVINFWKIFKDFQTLLQGRLPVTVNMASTINLIDIKRVLSFWSGTKTYEIDHIFRFYVTDMRFKDSNDT